MAIHETVRALNRYTCREILDRLRRGPMSVREIAATFKIGTRASTSQALALLLAADLVTRRREGRVHYYQLRAAGFKELARYLQGIVRDAEASSR